MKLSIARDEAAAVRVDIIGRVTQQDLISHRDPLYDLLGPEGYRRQVRLDLSETSYLDSSGVSWLLTCQRRIREAGGRLTLCRPHPVIANVLRVLKLEAVFEVDHALPPPPSPQPTAATEPPVAATVNSV
ncbi:MAG: STAS domain-containing protein [Pirellulaceae bacterium]|nr:STAS domain-containing protein [Pirellulaceae bacterium]